MIYKLTKFYYTLLGRNKKESESVEQKIVHLHKLKNQITKDILSVQKDVINIKKHNNKELDKMSKKLQNMNYTITDSIAVATGGFRNAKLNTNNT